MGEMKFKTKLEELRYWKKEIELCLESSRYFYGKYVKVEGETKTYEEYIKEQKIIRAARSCGKFDWRILLPDEMYKNETI